MSCAIPLSVFTEALTTAKVPKATITISTLWKWKYIKSYDLQYNRIPHFSYSLCIGDSISCQSSREHAILYSMQLQMFFLICPYQKHYSRCKGHVFVIFMIKSKLHSFLYISGHKSIQIPCLELSWVVYRWSLSLA